MDIPKYERKFRSNLIIEVVFEIFNHMSTFRTTL
jgi:hypothetical protein